MPLTHFGVEPRLLDTHIFLLMAHWVWLNLCHCSPSPSYLRHHSPLYICIAGEVDLHKHSSLYNPWRGWFDKMLNCSWFRSPSLFRNRIILWPCLFFCFVKVRKNILIYLPAVRLMRLWVIENKSAISIQWNIYIVWIIIMWLIQQQKKKLLEVSCRCSA